MSMRKHICKVLGIILFILSGCSARELPSNENSSSLESVSVSSSAASEVSPASSEILPVSSESQEVLPEEDILVPEVEPLEFEDIDFTAMTEDELKEVLGKVLDKATMLCRYGLACETVHFRGVDPDEKIVQNLSGWDCDCYPFKGCSYKTVAELKQAFLTVFPSEEVEGRLAHVFDQFVDYNGQIYVAIERSGYSDERNWNLESMKIVNLSSNECTVSMSVSWGMSDETIIAPLTFYFTDGHILVGTNYFATRR